jgi:hypothetical protein
MAIVNGSSPEAQAALQIRTVSSDQLTTNLDHNPDQGVDLIHLTPKVCFRNR